MPDNEEIKSVGAAVTIVTEIMKAAGNSNEVKIAANNLGKTAVTLTSALNNVLLPIAALNFSIAKAREYYERRFGEDMAASAAHIPKESIVEPKASISGPALQGLTFSFEEEPLKNLYLNLLASAMDGRHPDQALPAYVDVIKQLSGREALFLEYFCTEQIARPVVRYQMNSPVGDTFTISNNVLNTRTADGSMITISDFAILIDNWIRLGLIEISFDEKIGDSAYEFAVERPEHLKLYPEFTHLQVIQKGLVRPTAFGAAFAKAVGMPVRRTRELNFEFIAHAQMES